MLLALDDGLFPNSSDITYLNAASVALMPRSAEEAVVEWQRDLARAGTLRFDEQAERTVFDELRGVAARLFGVEPGEVAVAPSATELLASVAWAVMPPGESNIVSTRGIFPTTIYPWARVARHTGAELRLVEGRNGIVRHEDLIANIDDLTAVVCVSHVEYGTGQLFDLAGLADAAHAANALLVVDASQSAGAIPIDMATTGIDALVTSGYKWLCGPFGVALLIMASPVCERLDPGVVGFRSHRDMWELEADRLVLPHGARRFEASTMSYGCAIGLARSIEILLDIGTEAILTHDLALADLLVDGLRGRGAEIVSPVQGGARTPIVSARIPGCDSHTLASRLQEREVVVSPRGDLIRFSPHVYNRCEDIERAFEEIDRCA